MVKIQLCNFYLYLCLFVLSAAESKGLKPTKIVFSDRAHTYIYKVLGSLVLEGLEKLCFPPPRQVFWAILFGAYILCIVIFFDEMTY